MNRKTKLNDINKPFCQQKIYTAYDGKSEHGRSTMIIVCPFCGLHVTVYRWSVRGGGKQCPCGALLGGLSLAYKLKPSVLTQDVFKGAPDWVCYAFVDHKGGTWWSDKKPRIGKSKVDDADCFYHVGKVNHLCVGASDASEWQNSLIARERTDD